MRALQTPRSRFLLLTLPIAFTACAKGGGDERPQSEVQITASHHLFGFKSLAGFGSFPIVPEVVFTDRGVLNFFDDSSYTITRASGTSGKDTYAMAKTGDMTLYVTGAGRDPTVIFRGGYSLTTANADLFFTDRVSTSSSAALGLFVGTKVIPGQVELEGGWHALSMHVVFGQTILSPDNVARAAWGGVSIGAGAAGTVRTISGTGQQTAAPVTFGGSIQNLLQNGVGDGSCNLTVDYQLTGTPTDSRVFHAAAGPDLVVGLDADESDGEAGLLFLLRKHDAPATPADPQRVPGTFFIGGYTAFVNTGNPGSDVFVGVVTLSEAGGFRLDAIGNQGIDFSYTGIYTLLADGSMSIVIDGTDETWHAAIDREYKTFAFVDDFQEIRSNGSVELNLGFGIREKTP